MKKHKDGRHLLKRVYTNPRYRGKHLIIIGNEVFVARSAADAPRLFERVMRSHPHTTPTLAYVPQADTLILWVVA